MKWITRARPKTDRIACPWLIRQFIDPDAEIIYVPADQVLDTAERDGGHSFDAPGAEFTHRPAPGGHGLLAIGTGGLDVEADDQVLLARGTFVYDALYAWCARQVAAPAGPRA